MEFVVQNVHSTKSYKKILTLKNNFKQSNSSILCLTETALKQHDTTRFAFRFGYGHHQSYFFHDIDSVNPNSNRGVSIILR